MTPGTVTLVAAQSFVTPVETPVSSGCVTSTPVNRVTPPFHFCALSNVQVQLPVAASADVNTR